MKRSPMPARRAPLRRAGTLARRAGLRAVSSRRRETNLERRAALLEHYGPTPPCYAGPILAAAAEELTRYSSGPEPGELEAALHPQAARRLLEHAGAHRCTRLADDGHELLTRARGGSITDPANVMPACRACHELITAEPALADALGLTRHSWAGS